MKSENPLVSVIIPVYNTEEYLKECLDSLCNQTLKDIEIICIDDASDDNSSEILNDYAENDDRIVLLKNEVNQGQSISRNKGLKIATGEYITFLDSDDYMEFDAYEKLYKFAKDYDHDLIMFDAVRFNDEGVRWRSILHKKAGYTGVYPQTSVFDHKKLIYDTSISKFIKNDFIKRNNFKFIENVLYEDLLFSMEVLCASECLGVYPDVKYNWRVRYGYKKSVTQTVSDIKNLKDRILISNKIIDLLNSREKTKSLLDMFYIKLAEIDILQFINQLNSCSDEYKRIMHDEVIPLVLNFPKSAYDDLDDIDKVKYDLFLNNQWESLIALITSQRSLKNDIKDLRYQNRGLKRDIKKLEENNVDDLKLAKKRLKKENKRLKKEMKEIKSTKGWANYKIRNIYYRLFKKDSPANDDNELSKYDDKTRKELEKEIFYTNPELFNEIAKYRQFGMPKRYRNACKKYPVNNNMFFFESNLAKQYTGNPRYIYERMIELYPDFTYVWSYNGDENHIPGNPIVVKRKSDEYYKYLAQSGVIINNTTFPNWYHRPETFYLQTWHGTPYKRMHWDRYNPRNPIKKSSPHFYVKSTGWDTLLSPNHYSTIKFMSCFKYEGKILESGYPANDIFYDGEKLDLKRNLIREKLNIPDDALVYLYAPTWRDGGHIGHSMFKFDLLFDPVKFLDNAPDNSVLLIRSHHMSEATKELSVLEGRALDVSQWDDAVELMCASDILITDYSSIVFDWYCSKKPVIYYVPDLEEYETKTRGVYFDINEVNCGVICKSEDELYENLDVRDAPFYEKFYEEFCSFHDGKTTDRVIEYCLNKNKSSIKSNIKNILK